MTLRLEADQLGRSPSGKRPEVTLPRIKQPKTEGLVQLSIKGRLPFVIRPKIPAPDKGM